MIKVVETNKDGKVVLKPEELEKMLNDAYEEGKKEGKVVYVPCYTNTVCPSYCYKVINSPSTVPTYYTEVTC